MSLSLEAGRAAGRVTYPERVFAFSTTSCFLPASHPYLKARFLSVFIPTRVSRIPITSDCLSDSLALKQLYCLSFPYSLWGSEFSGCLQHVVRTRTIGNSCAPWCRDGLGVFHPDASSLSRWRLSSGRKSWISFTSPSGAKAHAREWLAMHPQGMLQDTAMQPQTGRQSGEDRGGVPLSWNHAAVSPAQNCYLSIDHSWPSEHARYGQLTFSKFLKTKGELVYWACFSSLFAIFFAFDPMWILQTLGFKKKGYLDTWTHS